MRAKALKFTQAIWLLLICLYSLKVIPAGGNTALIMTIFMVVYFVVTVGLFLDIRIAWFISVLPPLFVGLLSGVWSLLNVGTFITGHELYHDSPATIFVVLVVAMFSLLPSVILLALFWQERNYWLFRSRSKVS